MAMRIENLLEKSFDQGPVISVAHFATSYPSLWSSNEPQTGQSLQKGRDLKDEQAAQLLQQAKHLGLPLPEQESSTTQSASQSCQEMSVASGTNSQDQSMSSEPGQDESCGRSVEAENKPIFLFRNSEIVFNCSEADQTHPTVRVSYPPAADPYFSGLLAVYGPQAMMQPQIGSQMAGIASTRIPLPLSFAEDGPIFVNAKQYHGILRRRQSRAKLEAQYKLVKTRKPYLHESRHLHALNRIRGSGGRFLSTKKLQQSNQSSSSCINEAINTRKDDLKLENHVHQQACERRFTPSMSGSEISSISNCGIFCTQSDNNRFSGISIR